MREAVMLSLILKGLLVSQGVSLETCLKLKLQGGLMSYRPYRGLRRANFPEGTLLGSQSKHGANRKRFVSSDMERGHEAETKRTWNGREAGMQARMKRKGKAPEMKPETNSTWRRNETEPTPPKTNQAACWSSSPRSGGLRAAP